MMLPLTFSLVALTWLFQFGYAQDETSIYTDGATGIVFNTWPADGMTFGMALPPGALTVDATEFIGILTCESRAGQGTGWCGVSLGGGMNGNLLIMAYPYQGSILTSFRWASDYAHPTVYQGNAKLTQISSTISSAHYSLIFRCQNCLQWSQGEEQGAAPTSEGYLVLGCAYSSRSPANGACPNTLIVQQHDSQEIFAARFNNAAVNPSYTAWAAKAASTVTGACGGQTANPTPPTPSCSKKYTVISGDYCYLIAVNNGLTLDQFYTYNPGLICNPLQIGEVVCVKY